MYMIKINNNSLKNLAKAIYNVYARDQKGAL